MRPATADIGVSSGRSPGVGSSGLVRDAVDAAIQQLLAELLRGGEMQVREEEQILAHARELGRDRLLDLDDHVGLAQTSSADAMICAPAATYASSGIDEPTPALCSTRTVWPRCLRIATPAGVMPTRYS